MYQLTAPNAICGRVIGRGGSKINSITVSYLIQYALSDRHVDSFYIRELVSNISNMRKSVSFDF